MKRIHHTIAIASIIITACGGTTTLEDEIYDTQNRNTDSTTSESEDAIRNGVEGNRSVPWLS